MAGKQTNKQRSDETPVVYQDPLRSGEGPVTKSDSTVYTGARAVYVGTAGDLAVRLAGDDTPITFTAVPGGSLLPLEVVQVMSTGTSASNILVLY